jgi:hypothetical protein
VEIEVDLTDQCAIKQSMEKIIPLMLFPDDKEVRDRYSLMCLLAQDNPDKKHEIVGILFGHGDFGVKVLNRIIEEAMTAALIVKNFVEMSRLNVQRGGPSVKKAVWLIENLPKKIRKGQNVSKRTAMERWAKFKPVAHLWVSCLDNLPIDLFIHMVSGYSEAALNISEKSFRYFFISALWHKKFLVENGLKEAECMYDLNLNGVEPELSLEAVKPPSIQDELQQKMLNGIRGLQGFDRWSKPINYLNENFG